MPSIPLYELWLPGKEEGKRVRTPRLQPCGVSGIDILTKEVKIL
jgi:hypothetical protein